MTFEESYMFHSNAHNVTYTLDRPGILPNWPLAQGPRALRPLKRALALAESFAPTIFSHLFLLHISLSIYEHSADVNLANHVQTLGPPTFGTYDCVNESWSKKLVGLKIYALDYIPCEEFALYTYQFHCSALEGLGHETKKGCFYLTVTDGRNIP